VLLITAKLSPTFKTLNAITSNKWRCN